MRGKFLKIKLLVCLNKKSTRLTRILYQQQMENTLSTNGKIYIILLLDTPTINPEFRLAN